MGAFEAILLGVLQALTEFLPVSSSGHLVLGEHLLGLESDSSLLFDVAVHVGTLGAVAIVLRREIAGLIGASLQAVRDVTRGVPVRSVLADSAEVRTVGLIVVGSIPTAAIGLGLEPWIEERLRSPLPVGAMLLVTAAILTATRFVPQGHRVEADLTVTDALTIGIAQGLAVVPGISRSGSTIAIGLVAGLRRDTAARLSFLLSIPAILGALLLQLRDVGSVPPDVLRASVIGAATAMVVGWGALLALLKLVNAGKLHWFVPYLLVAGGLSIATSLP